MTKQITCKCGATATLATDQNYDAVGFFRVPDQQNGLRLIPVCSPCFKRVAVLAAEIVAITGTEYTMLSNILHSARRRGVL